MIVAISGKIGSGKTTFSEYLVNEFGFQRVSFASWMKNSLAWWFNIPHEYMTTQEGKDTYLTDFEIFQDNRFRVHVLAWFQDEAYYDDLPPFDALEDFLASIEGNLPESAEGLKVRDLLQLVGTEVLRAYDPDFHVKKLKQYLSQEIDIDPNARFVCDDVRFPNELAMFEELDALTIRVLRDGLTESNHPSETALDNAQFRLYWWNFHDDVEAYKASIGDYFRTCFFPETNWTSSDLDWKKAIDALLEEQVVQYGDTNDALDAENPALLAILTEQVGDVADMINYMRLWSTNESRTSDRENLRRSVLQVAAVAIMWAKKF